MGFFGCSHNWRNESDNDGEGGIYYDSRCSCSKCGKTKSHNWAKDTERISDNVKDGRHCYTTYTCLDCGASETRKSW